MQGCNIPNLANTTGQFGTVPCSDFTTFRGGYRVSQYSGVAITTFLGAAGRLRQLPASVQPKGKRGVALSSFGLPGLPLRGRPSGEPSSREGYQGSGRLRGGHGACWERRCRNDSNFVNREFVKHAVKANTEALLYAAVGFQMP